MHTCSATDLRHDLTSILREMPSGQSPVLVLSHGKPLIAVVSTQWGEQVDLIQKMQSQPEFLPANEIQGILARLIQELESDSSITLKDVVLKVVEQAKVVHDFRALQAKLNSCK